MATGKRSWRTLTAALAKRGVTSSRCRRNLRSRGTCRKISKRKRVEAACIGRETEIVFVSPFRQTAQPSETPPTPSTSIDRSPDRQHQHEPEERHEQARGDG